MSYGIPTLLHKEIDLGKVDYLDHGRKDCRVTIEVNLYDRGERGPEFAASGNIWNHLETDVYTCGQILDHVLELFPGDPKVRRIHEVWKRWHLNIVHGETLPQEIVSEVESW